MSPHLLDQRIDERAQLLFKERQQQVYVRTDRMFSVLLLWQWLASIAIAIWISPMAWHGHYSSVHIHVWTAIIFGGLITIWPVYLAQTRPGQVLTRHVIAIAQTLYSALLIHLTGGRIETHFHVFGSLAFLSFYRDWRVLVTASTIVAGDHILRGLLYPQSVYGVGIIEPWRWLEHAWWVAFEDFFLILACLWTVREMQASTRRQAQIEQTNAKIEELVRLRTEDLSRAQNKLAVQYEVASVAADSSSLSEAFEKILKILATYLFHDSGRIWGAFWSESKLRGVISCRESLQVPPGELDAFAKSCKRIDLDFSNSLPARVLKSGKVISLGDITEDGSSLPRLEIAKECGLNTAFAFPVTDSGKTLGAIEFFAEKEILLDQATIDLLQSLGSQIGQLIAYKKAETERVRLASVVQHSNDAIFTIGVDGRISSWNRGAERLFGCSADKAIGLPHTLFIPDEKQQELLTICPRVREGERIDNFETDFVPQPGKSVYVAISWTPLVDDTGKNAGCSVTLRDISERKEAEKRVNEFYSMVSHELRTPLTSIRGVLGLIEGNVVEGQEAAELVTIARGSSDRLIRLINDMLDLKKVESGKMELKCCKLAVDELVPECIYALKGMSEETDVRMSYKPISTGQINADWDKVTQIVTNLLSNAIKFSPSGSEVVVVTELVRPGRMRFSVIDKGPGIAQEDFAKLFEKFQQLDSSDSRPKGGTGLGLAITKALVEQHGGCIGVDSEVGHGSTFWFELPAISEIDGATSDAPKQSPRSIPVRATVSGDSLNVLLLEDDDGLAAVLRAFIESAGHRVIRAGTLAEARRCLATMEPGLVMLDLTLPDGNGLDLIKDLRNTESTVHTPIVVITGQQKQEQLLLNGTLVDWLTKPFDGDQLANVIDRALSLAGACKVLVVDDDAGTRRVVKTQLRALGLECIEAKDGSEAISMALEQSPDLIILDVTMPNVNGFGVVEALSKEKTKSTPLLIYTCSDLSIEDRNNLTLGITRYLTKGSVSQSDLDKVICELLGTSFTRHKEGVQLHLVKAEPEEANANSGNVGIRTG